MSEGKPNKVIARELDIKESTVKVFVRRILGKLNVSNRTELALLVRGWPVDTENEMSLTSTDNGYGSFDHKLAHDGNPVTRWMAANVAVAQDPAGNLKPAKDKSTERIDGIVAPSWRSAAPWSPRTSPSPSTPCSLCEGEGCHDARGTKALQPESAFT